MVLADACRDTHVELIARLFRGVLGRSVGGCVVSGGCGDGRDSWARSGHRGTSCPPCSPHVSEESGEKPFSRLPPKKRHTLAAVGLSSCRRHAGPTRWECPTNARFYNTSQLSTHVADVTPPSLPDFSSTYSREGAAVQIAVLGGSILGDYISEQVVAYVGGSLFLVFAAGTLLNIVNETGAAGLLN
jgi:hypothetical protein